MFGVGVWNPSFFYLFPSDQYGMIYGVNTMSMLPSSWVLIPLYEYIIRFVVYQVSYKNPQLSHDMDFATINYAIGLACTLTYLLPAALMLKASEIKRLYYKE